MAINRRDSRHDSRRYSAPVEEVQSGCEDPRCLKTTTETYFCADCASEYCADCWPLQVPHLPSKRGRDGMPHEKADGQIFTRFRNILHPQHNSLESIQYAHENDSSSKWFGVTKDHSGRLKFDDYGRYASLMSSFLPAAEHVHRYPQLVSFVGVTNAGKSTIIKMLIERALAKRNAPANTRWASPLVGSALHDSVPTSGDVNLYADPRTHMSALPILFADCEGFEGGERLPLGAMARWKAEQQQRQDQIPVSGSAASYHIEWANTEDTRQREFAVMNLYPRICYTFSDVVVFVLRNPKTFQSSVLSKLLDWGVNSLEKSINQPALPHAIVVLNATDPTVDDREWDTSFATQSLLMSVRGAIDGPDSVPRLQKLAEHWRQLGKNIASVEDLLLQYYSSFQVVRIPSSRYMLMDGQVSKLQTMIETSCAKSFSAKRKARMLTNGDELNTYFQAGFRHFSAHLNIPFDFVEVSLRNNPIPSDFGGHILHLATRIMGKFRKDAERLAWFFEHLSTMLASCIMLDCVRYRKGRMPELFRNYERSIDWALAEFFEMHWPCSFMLNNRKCALVKARHIKGHQDTIGVIASGDYESGISLDTAGSLFKDQLRSAMATIQRDFDYETDQNGKDEKVEDSMVALSLHKDYLRQFFHSVGVAAKLFSHSSCFVCLMNVPSHPLPCGHVLCSACIKAFGKNYGRSTVIVSQCPLHDESPPWSRWLKPVFIQFKPKGVGSRVLALDGGGVRGIVQLEIMREIEETLGNYIPIACFFDLIVGTGTGAVIAAALGIQKRRLANETIDMFMALCDMAYAPRLQMLPLMKLASFMGGSGMYKTKPLREALEMAFGHERKVFGGAQSAHDEIRVGMTAVTGAERQGVLLSNYHRAEESSSFYTMDRPSDASSEMDLWEALAASTATPGYFKPFLYNETSKTYLDASTTICNPSAMAERERKLIWPDTEDLDPDLFLSLGCGQNRYRIGQKLKEFKSMKRPAGQRTSKATFLQQATSFLSAGRQDDILQAEIEWLRFEESLPAALDPNGKHYLRFNPDLDEDPPNTDDRGSLRSLRQTVRNRLKLPHRQTAILHLGHRLVATSFYFDLQKKSLKADSAYICKGSILCRFEDGSEYVSMLGRFLYSKLSRAFTPYFIVHPTVGESETFTIPIQRTVIETMIYRSIFEITDIEITVSEEMKPTSISLFLSEHELLGPSGLPISGCPRWLLLDKSPRLVNEAQIPPQSLNRTFTDWSSKPASTLAPSVAPSIAPTTPATITAPTTAPTNAPTNALANAPTTTPNSGRPPSESLTPATAIPPASALSPVSAVPSSAVFPSYAAPATESALTPATALPRSAASPPPSDVSAAPPPLDTRPPSTAPAPPPNPAAGVAPKLRVNHKPTASDDSYSTATESPGPSRPNLAALSIRPSMEYGLAPNEASPVEPVSPAGGPSYTDTDGAARKTNRFWTYIGPQHMARNKENFTEEQIRKYVGDLDIDADQKDVTFADLMARMRGQKRIVQGHGGLLSELPANEEPRRSQSRSPGLDDREFA